MVYKIKFSKKKCVGCGACVVACPENYEIIEEKAKPKTKQIETKDCNFDAEEICPNKAITITEE
jgi:ferredoxin